MADRKAKKSGQKQQEFLSWYKKVASKLGLSSNPYEKEHYYDYEGYYDSSGGKIPTKKDDYHFPSKFKIEGHPRMVINGVDTKTGKKVPDAKRAIDKAFLEVKKKK